MITGIIGYYGGHVSPYHNAIIKRIIKYYDGHVSAYYNTIIN